MVKIIRNFYIANIIIFSILIPLSFFLAYLWTNSAVANMAANTDEAGEAIAIVFVAIIMAALAFMVAIVVVIACILSLVLAIIGFVKINKAKEPKNMKKIAITQIVFLGNIVPAILCLRLKPSDFNLEEKKEEELTQQ